VGEENAGEAEGRVAERVASEGFGGLIDPAIAAPNGEKAEGDDHAGGDNG
jgi:hypothetical protein